MDESRRTILEMLEQGRISQEEATRLLNALEDGEEASAEAGVSLTLHPEAPLPDLGALEAAEEGQDAVVHLDEGVAIHVGDKLTVHINPDREGGGPAKSDLPGAAAPMPPIPPVPPVPPELPASPEALARYQEDVRRYQEECQAQLEGSRRQVEEYRRQMEEQKANFQKEIARQRQLAQQVRADSGFWPLTDEEYNRIYTKAYGEVYEPGYEELFSQVPAGSPEFSQRVDRLANEAVCAAENAVEQARAEKLAEGAQGPGGWQENGQQPDDWQEKTRRWRAKLGEIGAEISRAINGIGARISEEVQDAVEVVQDAMEEVKDSLGELAEAWEDWAEEEGEDEEEDDEDEEDEEDSDEEEDVDLEDFQNVSAQAVQPEDGHYVSRSCCNMSALEKLDVNWSSGQVEISPWDGDYVEVSEYSERPLNEEEKMRVYVHDARELVVHFTAWQNHSGRRIGKGWNVTVRPFPPKRLTVKIPQGLCGQVENLKVAAVSADVSLSRLSGGSFAVSTVSGGIWADSLHAEKLGLSSVSGAVQAQGLSAESLRLHSVSGVVKGEGLAAETAKISSISGSVKAQGSAERFKVSTTSGKARLAVDQPPEKASFNTVSGRLTLVMPENDGFTASYKSVSGSFSSDFPLTGSLSKKKGKGVYGTGETKIEMSSTSGKLEILKA